MENRPLLLLLPRLPDGRMILLERQGGSGSGRWELPAAPLPTGENLLQHAAQLLHLTVDYIPTRLEPLGMIYTPGETHCFLADLLRPSPWAPVAGKRAMTTPVHADELRQLIRTGAIRCGKLLGALMLLDAAERHANVAAGK